MVTSLKSLDPETSYSLHNDRWTCIAVCVQCQCGKLPRWFGIDLKSYTT